MFFILLLLLSLGLYAADQTNKELIEKNVYTTGKPETKEEPQTARLKETLEQAAELEKQKTAKKAAVSSTELSGTVIKVLCKKDATELIECPIEYINEYFVTLKHMVEDLGSEAIIPLENVTAPIFNCLIGLAKTLYNTTPRNTLPDARKTFKEITQQFLTPDLFAQLLIQANYLDVTAVIYTPVFNFTFKSLLAALYADFLKIKAPQIINAGTNMVSCDDLPFELEPLVAGWLLHDLLENSAPVTQKKDFGFSGNLHTGPVLSNTGSRHGFACIWEQIGGSGFLQGSTMSSRYSYFDFSKKDRFQEKKIASTIEQPISIDEKSQCAISEDGRYMLIIFGDNPTKVALYDLLTPKENKSKAIEPIQVAQLNHPIADIVTCLFNDKMGTFIIIACSDTPPTKTFYLYQASPSANALYLSEPSMVDISDKNNAIFDANKMYWSCINGKLFGGYYKYIDFMDVSKVITYANKKLYECFFDKKNDAWFYTEDEKKHSLDFCLLTTQVTERPVTDNNATIKVAVQNVFIPDFCRILQKKLGTSIFNSNGLNFDATHLCSYFVTTKSNRYWKEDTVCINYPWNPKLTTAINILDKKVTSGQYQVLIDAYFLYHYHMNNATWHTYCKDTLQYTSDEIKKTYKLDEEEAPKSSWWFFSSEKS